MKQVHEKGPALPEPSDAERRAIVHARERQALRRPAFNLGISQKDTSTSKVGSANADQKGWGARLFETFGTTSSDFVEVQLNRISTIFRDGEGKIDTGTVEMVASVLDGAQPANEIEAMLIIQMATTHAMVMKVTARLAGLRAGTTLQANDSASVTLARLHRAFTMQVETLAAVRRGGKQKVIVEHVHVYPGGQAIVGNVTTGGTGAEIGKGQQPHAIEPFAGGGELWGEN